MLDSGSTVSFIRECIATSLPAVKQLASNGLQLASSAGEPIPVVGRVVLPVQVVGVCAEHPMILWGFFSRTRHGTFPVLSMPFGLSGAPGSFQRLMDKVCHVLSFVTTYLEDVLVYSTTVQELGCSLCMAHTHKCQ